MLIMLVGKLKEYRVMIADAESFFEQEPELIEVCDFFSCRKEVTDGHVRLILCGYDQGKPKIFDLNKQSVAEINNGNNTVLFAGSGAKAAREKYLQSLAGKLEDSGQENITKNMDTDAPILSETDQQANLLFHAANDAAQKVQSVGGDAESKSGA